MVQRKYKKRTGQHLGAHALEVVKGLHLAVKLRSLRDGEDLVVDFALVDELEVAKNVNGGNGSEWHRLVAHL